MSLGLALLVPFAAAALAPLGVRLARRSAGLLLALVPLGLTVWFSLQAPSVLAGQPLSAQWRWVPALDISLSLRLDGLSLLMALLICGMGTLVVLYAARYLGEHSHLGRFYGWLLVFMGSMLGIVLADHLLLVFIFWEGTTFSSFILIGFEHHEEASRRSALRALLITALGGQALLVGLLLLGGVANTWVLSQLASVADSVRASPRYLAILLLVLAGAFTKSAQVPFHTWLPGAMSAPTPVSAYLHAATMVKAGIYLLARMLPVLGGTPLWEGILLVVGALTMASGALLALGHGDLKLLLAYATVSVLGTLVLLLGPGTPHAVQALIVFLTAHALYKGTLFLVAGIVDHETGTRELPRLSGLLRPLPLTGAAALAGALSMAGLPPAFGFIGKELVYAALLEHRHGPWLLLAAVVGFAGLVAAALRASVGLFLGPTVCADRPPHEVHEAHPSLWTGPVLLATLGLLLGVVPWVLTPLLGAAAGAVGGPEAGQLKLELWHGLNVALGLSALSVALGAGAYVARAPVLRGLRALDLGRWGPETLYQASLDGLAWLASAQTRLLQNGQLRRYVFVTVATLASLLALALWAHAPRTPSGPWLPLAVHETAVLLLILGASVTTVLARSVLSALIALGAVGLGEALVYVLFGAPDLAVTQVVVQTLTVVLFALVFSRAPVRAQPRARWRDAAVALAAGALLCWVLLHVVEVPPHTRMADYYSAHAATQAHGLNIVNTILVDFRALDTLGEIAVLATAGVGVYLLFRVRETARRPG